MISIGPWISFRKGNDKTQTFQRDDAYSTTRLSRCPANYNQMCPARLTIGCGIIRRRLVEYYSDLTNSPVLENNL